MTIMSHLFVKGDLMLIFLVRRDWRIEKRVGLRSRMACT